MQEDPEEFEKLRRLLALKRNEVPPPGYFDSFSDKVINRIASEEMPRASLWQQLSALFKTRPAISWSFSVAALLTLFAVSSEFENPPVGGQSNSVPPVAGFGGSPASASLAFSTNDNGRYFDSTKMTLELPGRVATNSEPGVDSLFKTPFDHLVQPASFSP